MWDQKVAGFKRVVPNPRQTEYMCKVEHYRIFNNLCVRRPSIYLPVKVAVVFHHTLLCLCDF